MISTETWDDYEERSSKLAMLFMENLSKAKDLVVEDYPVDYATHKFICSVYNSNIIAMGLVVNFGLTAMQIITREVDDANARELIKNFHSLEEKLASQNEFLEKQTSTHTASTRNL